LVLRPFKMTLQSESHS